MWTCGPAAQNLILMLESDDGVAWRPVDLSRHPLPLGPGGAPRKRTVPNEVMLVQWSPGSPDGGGGMTGALDDDGPGVPAAERLKMLIMDGNVLASADGTEWKLLKRAGKWQGPPGRTAGAPSSS